MKKRSTFEKIVDSPSQSKLVLQGNTAFALGVMHAGYHAADGYPGTPSTEVIDKSLAFVQDRIQVGWSVNEAVAVGVGVGRAIAGHDSVITMKTPGVFQAADVISTSAFYTAPAGALVIYVATDYIPSSTQHVIDTRYFFASLRLPVLEPRNHQEMYEIAWTAADISKKFNTPVIVLASGILAHSEGLITTKKPRRINPRQIPENLHDWMLMPAIARMNYNKATLERMPLIQKSLESSGLVEEIEGLEDWGIIVGGETNIFVKEALQVLGVKPSILNLAVTNPLPQKRIKAFADKIKDKLFVIECGDKFLQEKIQLMGIDVIAKEEFSNITNWTPDTVLEFLSKHINIQYNSNKIEIGIKPVKRPPSICAGCPYRAFALVVSKLKKQKKIFASFGDIGCSTLLYFNNALDTVSCMGSSDSMRQGFVMSRPEMAERSISVIGDSCECHSGLNSTRNAVFRNVPGVKVILDNKTTAMTGGQPAPSSTVNLANQPHKFILKKAIEAEVERTVVVDAFNLLEIEKVLKKSLDLAKKGKFSTIILEGPCIKEVESTKRIRKIKFDYEKCKNCGLCNICPGIEIGEDKTPRFTNFCSNCGSTSQVCLQYCPFDAIVPLEQEPQTSIQELPKPDIVPAVGVKKNKLPDSLRLAIRGIGGQGNLFFGKVLSEVAMRTPYSKTHIVKGDTHGMAQLGGSVISTFSCGKVFSPIFAPNSADILVVMEIGEVLRPGFLDLLKSKGTIVFNKFSSLPINVKKEDYPRFSEIKKALLAYRVIEIDANKLVYDLGDKSGITANVAILGLLSTIEPVNKIPEEIWLSAIMSVSPNDFIKSANLLAFNAGKR